MLRRPALVFVLAILLASCGGSPKTTELRLDALTTLIKAQIGRGAKGGDAAHGFRAGR